MSELTDVLIRQAPARETQYEIRDTERKGLRVVVWPSGAKSFVYRYSHGGQYRKLTLGVYGEMTLAQAFAARTGAKDALQAGRDPADARKRGTNADATVTAHVALYEQQHLATLAESSAKYIKVELARIVTAIGSKDIATVTDADIRRIVNKAMERGPSAKCTTYKVCKAFFGWCVTERYIAESPCAKIKRPSKDNIRERFLDDAEIKLLWDAADKVGGAPGNLCKLLLLTGMRRTEVTHLERSEVKDDCIVIRGERTKNGVSHTVPITPAIRRVLDALPRTGKFVLTGTNTGMGGHTKAKAKVAPAIEPWTYHDLRRTFASGLARLGTPIQVTERCLNHVSGVGGAPLVRIYQKHDYAKEAVAAFERWSAHVEALVTEKEAVAA
jgi:integrase